MRQTRNFPRSDVMENVVPTAIFSFNRKTSMQLQKGEKSVDPLVLWEGGETKLVDDKVFADSRYLSRQVLT